MKIKFKKYVKKSFVTGNFKNKISKHWKTTFTAPKVTTITTTSIWRKIFNEIKDYSILIGKLFLAIFDPKTIFYQCPLCHRLIKKNTTKCNHCGSKIGWEDIEK